MYQPQIPRQADRPETIFPITNVIPVQLQEGGTVWKFTILFFS